MHKRATSKRRAAEPEKETRMEAVSYTHLDVYKRQEYNKIKHKKNHKCTYNKERNNCSTMTEIECKILNRIYV